MKTILSRSSFAFLALLFSVTCHAQTIAGKIINELSGEPLVAVTILEEGTTNGVSSSIDGSFLITLEGKSVYLNVSGIGYISQRVNAIDNIIVRLQESVTSLNEIVVSASRNEQKKTAVPIAISTIGTAKIKELKATSIHQLVNQTPGVFMVDLGNEQHSMSIRQPLGYGATYLYLEDGIPIRTSGVFNHNALLEMNMASVGKIEIIRGPASSQYGSEAIGGAINFISLKPSSFLTAGVEVQANSIGYKRSDFYVSNTIGKVGVRLSGYYANQKDGYLEHSDFDKLAISLNTSVELASRSILSWKTSIVDYASDMSGSLDSTAFFDQVYTSKQTFTNREVDAVRSKIQLNQYWNNSSKSSLVVIYRNNSIRQIPSYRIKDDFKPWIGSGNPLLAHGEKNENEFESFSMLLHHKELIEKYGLEVNGGLSLDNSPNSYQANYIAISKTKEGFYESFITQDSALAHYDVNLLNTAGFLHANLKLTSRVKLIAATRFDNFKYDFKNSLDSNAFSGVPNSINNFQQWTPKIGATWSVEKNTTIYGNVSKGFVPPQVGELYRGVKVPSIGPASYINMEIGLNSILWKDKIVTEIAAYKMKGENEIISVRMDDGSTEKRNAGSTSHYGIEFQFKYLLSKSTQFRIGGTRSEHRFVDYIESGKDYSNKEMTRAPNWIVNSSIRYEPSFFKGFRINLEWQYMSGYFMDEINTKLYEGFNLVNLRTGYKKGNIEVWVNAINLANSLYSNNASSSKWGQSYTLGKPRNYTIGLAYHFKK